MRPIYLPIYLLTLILIFNGCGSRSSMQQSAEEARELRMMTYNIKYDNPDDSLNSWDQRREKVTGLLQYHQPDIIGTQEGLLHQLNDIKESIDRYDWLGKGRKDGSKEGEFSAILYDRTKLHAKSDTTLWLSPTPGQPSQGWDAAFPRIVTAARLVHKQSQQQFLVFNTHFDHVGDTARKRSAELLHKFIGDFSQQGEAYILMGDFNVTPGSKPYQILTEPADSLNNSIPLRDSFHASELPHYGPAGTYTGFEVTQPGRRIDYIFCSPELTVKRHATLTDFNHMRFPSDHLPVVADIRIGM